MYPFESFDRASKTGKEHITQATLFCFQDQVTYEDNQRTDTNQIGT